MPKGESRCDWAVRQSADWVWKTLPRTSVFFVRVLGNLCCVSGLAVSLPYPPFFIDGQLMYINGTQFASANDFFRINSRKKAVFRAHRRHFKRPRGFWHLAFEFVIGLSKQNNKCCDRSLYKFEGASPFFFFSWGNYKFRRLEFSCFSQVQVHFIQRWRKSVSWSLLWSRSIS